MLFLQHYQPQPSISFLILQELCLGLSHLVEHLLILHLLLRTSLSLSGVTASTSTSTGALVVAGGVGVAGTIYSGGNLNVYDTITFLALAPGGSGKYQYVSLPNQSIYGITFSGYIGTISTATGTSFYMITAGGGNINPNSGSISSYIGFYAPSPFMPFGTIANYYGGYFNVGALDGVTITKNIAVYADNMCVGNNTLTPPANGIVVSGAVNVSSTTASTSTSTGALIVAGGVGIGGSVYVGNLQWI